MAKRDMGDVKTMDRGLWTRAGQGPCAIPREGAGIHDRIRIEVGGDREQGNRVVEVESAGPHVFTGEVTVVVQECRDAPRVIGLGQARLDGNGRIGRHRVVPPSPDIRQCVDDQVVELGFGDTRLEVAFGAFNAQTEWSQGGV